MNAPEKIPTGLSPLTDDPRYIGQSVPRNGARRLTEGRGAYVDDLRFARLAHVVFWRSPVAHMRIVSVDGSYARMMPGVLAVVDGKQMATLCKPWVATLGHLAGMKSARMCFELMTSYAPPYALRVITVNFGTVASA